MKPFPKNILLNYLHYILHEENHSLIKKFLKIQLQQPTKHDWGTQIMKDLDELEINLTIEEIENMHK